MLWDEIEKDIEKRRLGIELIGSVAHLGWGVDALEQSSLVALASRDRWKSYFPAGSRDAIWYISEISDASMALPFASAQKPLMSDVIAVRFAQNRSLKPFVRKVMLYDVAHPVQALRRMQRTALVMISCVCKHFQPHSMWTSTLLNVIYTFLVFVWLLDRSEEDRFTYGLTKFLMRAIGWS
jgi:hypothetical protein